MKFSSWIKTPVKLNKGDKVTAMVALPHIPQMTLEWTVARENKATYTVWAAYGNGCLLKLYLNKATGKITR